MRFEWVKEEGRIEGRAEGRVDTIFSLVKGGYITKEIAMSQLDVSEEGFSEKYGKWLADKCNTEKGV